MTKQTFAQKFVEFYSDYDNIRKISKASILIMAIMWLLLGIFDLYLGVIFRNDLIIIAPLLCWFSYRMFKRWKTMNKEDLQDKIEKTLSI